MSPRTMPLGWTLVAASALVVLVTGLGSDPLAAAAEARYRGTVVDEQGSPVEGVRVTIASQSAGTEVTETTDEKGNFTILIVDATHPPYTLKLEKEGYLTVEGPIEVEIGSLKRREFTMPKAAEEAPAPGAGSSEAIELYNAGAALYNQGDAEGAIRKFEAAVEIDPDFVAAWQRLATLTAANGEYETTLTATDRWLEIEPESQEARLLRYDALIELGREAEAKKLMDGLLASGGGPELAKRLFNLGVSTKKQGDEEVALGYFERAVEADPGFIEGWLTLASLRLTEGRHEEAIDATEKVLQARPGDGEALTIQYEATKALGQTERAAELLEKMGATSDDPQVLYRRGVAMFNASNYADAIETLGKAIEGDPDLARAHYVLGLALINRGDEEAALEHLRRFLELAPDDPDAGSARAMLDHLEG